MILRVAVAAVALARAGRASAQVKTTTAVAAERFVPALGPASLLGIEGTSVTPWGQTSFAVAVDELRDAIALATVNTGAAVSRPGHDPLVGDLGLEAGLDKPHAIAL